MENKTKTIIEWAEKGGYSGVPHQNQKGRWTGVRVLVDDDIAWLFLDPKFFQAIGRAVGWKESELGDDICFMCGCKKREKEECDYSSKHRYGKDEWKEHYLKFHKVNADTLSIDSAIDYLYGLLPVNE
jgi:hypothetical protein